MAATALADSIEQQDLRGSLRKADYSAAQVPTCSRTRVAALGILRFAIQMLAAAGVAFPATQTPPEGRAAAVSRQLREMSLDAAECYRIRDFGFHKEELKYYFNDGFAIFATPLRGSRMALYFSGDVEGGDAEVLVTPPHRGERKSLAKFTGSPTLNEHFRNGLFLFTDGTGDKLHEEIRRKGVKSAEMGLMLSADYSSTVRNLAESFELRFLQDLENPDRAEQGLFYSTIATRRLGAFDLIYDPVAREQVVIGQSVTRDDRGAFDVWSSFEAAPFRTGKKARPASVFTMDNFRIDATLESDLNLKVITRARLKGNMPGVKVLAFELTERMKIDEVWIDGKPAEIFRKEQLRAAAPRPSENAVFLLLAPDGFDSAKPHEVEFRHQGHIIHKAGERVYFVSSRGTWYPHMRGEFSHYDLTFRYPKSLDLVASGDVVESRVEGEQRITRRVTPAPIRFAGFNLGEYESVRVVRGPYTIEVFGNKKLDATLMPRLLAPAPPALVPGRRARTPELPPPAPPDPLAQFKTLANNVVSAFESMAADLGPPPIKTLTVAPIPGSFGQGFPGLVYMSTMAYLAPVDLPQFVRDRNSHLFYSEILAAHEVAHQWWGNLVTSAGYQDEWLQEALANYTALMYVEKKKGAKAIEGVLSDYRRHLLERNEQGAVVESEGPITMGIRLQNSRTVHSWRVIVYEKGTWILHMLRKQIGDPGFTRMLGEITRRYTRKPFSTEDLRKIAASYLPPKSPDPQLEVFFDNWVYSAGVPNLKLTPKVSTGLKVSGTITQSGVPEEFEVDVPVEVSFVRGPSQTFWVRSSTGEPTEFTLSLKQPAARISIGAGILRADN